MTYDANADAFLSYYEAINMLRIQFKLVKLIKSRTK
jgi:hypothetical protein